MLHSLQRVFGRPLMRFAASFAGIGLPSDSQTQARTTLADLQSALLACLEDLSDAATSRTQAQAVEQLQHKITAAASGRALWQLRSEVYSLVAKWRSQTEAALRINALLRLFEGHVPEAARVPLGSAQPLRRNSR